MANKVVVLNGGKYETVSGTTDGQLLTWTASTESWSAAAAASSGIPYDLRGMFVGNPASSAIIDRFVADRAVTVSTTSTDHKFYCVEKPASGTVVLTLKRKRDNASVEVDILTATFDSATSISDNGLYAATVSAVTHENLAAKDFVRLVVGTTQAAFSTPVYTIFATA